MMKVILDWFLLFFMLDNLKVEKIPSNYQIFSGKYINVIGFHQTENPKQCIY